MTLSPNTRHTFYTFITGAKVTWTSHPHRDLGVLDIRLSHTGVLLRWIALLSASWFWTFRQQIMTWPD